MRYFLNKKEISEGQAVELQESGQAKVRRGASGPVPQWLGGTLTSDKTSGWIQMVDGPSQVWLESVMADDEKVLPMCAAQKL